MFSVITMFTQNRYYIAAKMVTVVGRHSGKTVNLTLGENCEFNTR